MSPVDLPPTREQVDEAVVGHELVIVTSSTIAVVPWPAGDEVTVGRAAEAHIRLQGGAVSRLHAVFRRTDQGFTIEDLGSANGCHVSGVRLPAHERAPLALGDAVHLGEHVLLVRAVRTSEAAPAAEPAEDAPVIASAVMRRLQSLTDPIATSRLGVLVLGETGAGKDVFARSLHDRSPRRLCAFVRVSCAGLTEVELERALAAATATGGTVFLDEIGELPAGLQAKLLHVIETEARPLDVRFIAATNRDLDADIATGRFRSDLYYRLAGFVARIPPLRERPEDILPLAEELARRAARASGVSVASFTAAATSALLAHAWPGNVRELRNTIERAVVLAQGQPIDVHHLPEPTETVADEVAIDASTETAFDLTPVELAERDRLIAALKAASGNQSHAARALGVSRTTLLNRLDALRIARPRKRPQF
jgi:DNA-binding NtrC family response regulator